MPNLAALARPTPFTIYLRRGNTHAFSFYTRPLSDISATDFEAVVHNMAAPDEVVATYTVTRPTDELALFSLSIAQIEALEVGTYAFYARFRAPGDATVKTFFYGTAVVLEV